MGINIPDIYTVINYGAPSTLESFSQESGRAGRDGNAAFSVLLYSGYTLRKGLNDQYMIKYCKSLSCRSMVLLDYFKLSISDEDHFFENDSVHKVTSTHSCCDNCRLICKCSECPEVPNVIKSICDPSAYCGSDLPMDEQPEDVRPVDDQSLLLVKDNLLDYKDEMRSDAELALDVPINDPYDINVEQITERCGYLLIAEDVMTHTSITDYNIALDVIELLDEVIPLA